MFYSSHLTNACFLLHPLLLLGSLQLANELFLLTRLLLLQSSQIINSFLSSYMFYCSQLTNACFLLHLLPILGSSHLANALFLLPSSQLANALFLLPLLSLKLSTDKSDLSFVLASTLAELTTRRFSIFLSHLPLLKSSQIINAISLSLSFLFSYMLPKLTTL
jgi:hypothetical protein